MYSNTSIDNTLHQRFCDWAEQRKPQEETLLSCYQDMMRINRDDEGAGSGMSRSQQSKLFIGSTRGKIRSAKAKIKDVMFGSGAMPFDTEPTNEELKQFADTVEEILAYQFKEMGYESTLSSGTNALTTYGTGFTFGPFVRTKKHKSVAATTDAMGNVQIVDSEHEYPCPYFEHARTMDCYPDPEAEDVDPESGRGIFWAARKQKEFILGLKGEEGYWDDALEFAYKQTASEYSDQGSDRLALARSAVYRYGSDGRVWFVRYFGTIPVNEFVAWKLASGQIEEDQAAEFDDVDERETMEAIVIMAGGIVAKMDPAPNDKRPVYRCVYEDVEHEMWGVGIAQNNNPHQKVINASFRAFVENKSYVLNPSRSIDRSKFLPTEDFVKRPGKVYEMQPGLEPEERQTAIIVHNETDVSDGWMSLINLSEQFSDDDTAVTKYTQGDDSNHLNKTATGISMIMNAGSLPIKEVLGNIDRMWIEKHVGALIDWNLKYLSPETVKVLFGEKQAQIWQAIQTYGKTSFMKWFATGAKTFMMREVLMNKLQGYVQLVLSGGEATIPLVDVRELLDQVWRAGQVGLESPVIKEDDKTAQAVEQVKAEMMQVIEQLQGQLKEATDRKVIDMARYVSESQRTGIEIEKAHADIDKTEAETVATLVKVGIDPSAGLMKQGIEVNGTSEDTDAETGRDPEPATGADSAEAAAG